MDASLPTHAPPCRGRTLNSRRHAAVTVASSDSVERRKRWSGRRSGARASRPNGARHASWSPRAALGFRADAGSLTHQIRQAIRQLAYVDRDLGPHACTRIFATPRSCSSGPYRIAARCPFRSRVAQLVCKLLRRQTMQSSSTMPASRKRFADLRRRLGRIGELQGKPVRACSARRRAVRVAPTHREGESAREMRQPREGVPWRTELQGRRTGRLSRCSRSPGRSTRNVSKTVLV